MESCVFEVRDLSGGTRRVPLDDFPFSIGRGSENNLVLQDVSVSRRHATVYRDFDRLLISDNSSRNGVYVNHEKIQDRRELRAGDVVRIGAVDIQVLEISPPLELAAEDTGTLRFLPTPPTLDLREVLSGDQKPRKETGPFQSCESLLSLLTEAPLPQMFESVFDAIESVKRFDRCFILSFEDETAESPRVLAWRIHSQTRLQGAAAGAEALVSKDVLHRVVDSGEAVLVTRGEGDFVPSRSFLLSGAGTALCFPLATRDQVNGVLYLDRVVGEEGFCRKDVELLAPLVDLTALKIESFLLTEEHVAGRILKRDMDVAEAVQRDFFPARPPVLPGYALDAFAQPCGQVGGDFFDLILDSAGGLVLALGDVSGKGLPSALYMVGVLSALRAHCEDGLDLPLLMRRLEKYARLNFRSDHFLTLFLARLDPRSGTMRYCNAGHLPPVILSADGRVRDLHWGDPALNILEWRDFQCFECRLEPGDLFFACTDGIVETESKRGCQFGRERLAECLQQNRDKDLTFVREAVFTSVRSFSRGKRPGDDRTMILLRREGSPQGPFPEAEEVYRAEISTDLPERNGVIDAVLQRLDELGCKPDGFFDRLCLDESISNAMIHGNGLDPAKKVGVRVWCSPRRWEVEVRDEGRGFDWQEELHRVSRDPGIERPSGRGIALLLASGADVRFLEGGTRVIIGRDRQ